MEFTVKIKCDNDAFKYGPEEVARLLRIIANRVEYENAQSGQVADDNGNAVGSYGFDLDKKGK